MQHRRFLVAAIAACLLTTVATELQASPTVAGGAEANLKPQLRSRRWRPQTDKVAKKKLSKVPGEGWTQPVPLFVMMPLDTVDPVNNTILDIKALYEQLTELKKAGCEGVMADIWWGIVEREGPLMYDWGGYDQLVTAVTDVGLKLQAVMSFHQCGGNVGDACTITLPPWVLAAGEANNEIWYTDMDRNRNTEYISLGADDAPVFGGRTPLDMYRDFMRSFADRYKEYMPDVIIEAQIGLGPAGEMRYPSYPLKMWNFPGIGQFQCYDRYMRRDLVRAAIKANKPDLGLLWPPHPQDVGNYNFSSDHTEFFRDGGMWQTSEAEFFLEWYSQALIKHGDAVLGKAQEVFAGTGVILAAKVAGIHWQTDTKSHGPELTAGYYTTAKRDGYGPIAQMFAKRGAMFDFTCLEMRDEELPTWAKSLPSILVDHTKRTAIKHGCMYAGENALPRFDRRGFEQMQDQCFSQGKSIASFTYLRLGEDLMDEDKNWNEFVRFAKEMRAAKRFPTWSQIPLERQSKRGEVPHLHLDHPHPEDLEPPKLFFGGRQIMGVGVRRTITEVGTLIEASDTEPFQSGVQAGQRAGKYAQIDVGQEGQAAQPQAQAHRIAMSSG